MHRIINLMLSQVIKQMFDANRQAKKTMKDDVNYQFPICKACPASVTELELELDMPFQLSSRVGLTMESLPGHELGSDHSEKISWESFPFEPAIHHTKRLFVRSHKVWKAVFWSFPIALKFGRCACQISNPHEQFNTHSRGFETLRREKTNPTRTKKK